MGHAPRNQTEGEMLYRVLSVAIVVAALGLLLGGAGLTAQGAAQEKGAQADKNTHEGTVVSAKDHKLIMKGKDNKEHSHEVAATAKIACDGKECKLEDLKSGTRIRVTTNDTNQATRIEATTKSDSKKSGTENR